MSIDLHKKAERAGIILKKQGIATPPRLRVGLISDISGSMKEEYLDGHVQEAVNHVLGLAMAFDPSHTLDVFVFDDQYAQLPVPATPKNYQDYVRRQILTENEIPKWGSTEYAGVIHAFQDHYFGRDERHSAHWRPHHSIGGMLGRMFHHNEPATPAQDPSWRNIPVLGLLFTDGDNSDHRESEIAIQRSADFPIFWSLVGMGPHGFRFLRQMDQEFDDVEFINMRNLRISDEELYSQLVSPKLTRWLKRYETVAA
jgi:hypothetical protein